MPAFDQPAQFDEDAYFDRRMRSYEHDYAEDKIGRELYVIGGGTIDATKAAFSREHIGGTAVEAAASLGLGFALRAAETKIPLLRPAIAVGGAALTFSFIKDLVGNGAEIGRTMADTWRHKDHQEQNRHAFAQNGGKFVFDLALTSVAGSAGSIAGNSILFGRNSNFSRIGTYDGIGLTGKASSPHARLFRDDNALATIFEDTKQSTLKFEAKTLRDGKISKSSSANAFLVSEDGLAVTNYHCVKGKDLLAVTDYQGVKFKASVVAASKSKDVAILQLEKNEASSLFKPLKLADMDAKAGDKVYLVSHQSKLQEPTLSPGRIKDVIALPFSDRIDVPASATVRKISVSVSPFKHEEILKPRPSDEELNSFIRSERLLANYFSRPGFSGSALLNERGEVAGIHVGAVGKWFSQITSRNDATPVSSIKKVLEEALLKRE